MKVSKRRLFYI